MTYLEQAVEGLRAVKAAPDRYVFIKDGRWHTATGSEMISYIENLAEIGRPLPLWWQPGVKVVWKIDVPTGTPGRDKRYPSKAVALAVAKAERIKDAKKKISAVTASLDTGLEIAA